MHLFLIAVIALLAMPPAAPAAPAVISADAAIAAALRAQADVTIQGLGNRVSQMGPDGDANYGASHPAIAYNSADNQYLVVWVGDTTGGVVNDEFEVWGQRIDAASGRPIGANFRVSRMGPDGNTVYGANHPAIAYNTADNQYMVVWYGDTTAGGLADEEFEIWGQRLSNTGAELGVNFRISQMGPDGDNAYDAYEPAIVYNAADNQYLVVWWGDTNAGGLADDESEVWGQRLNGDGAALGEDFRVSATGPSDGGTLYNASNVVIAAGASGEMLIAWKADGALGGLIDEELEIWSRIIRPARQQAPSRVYLPLVVR